MSEPPQEFPSDLAYATPPHTDNAEMLLKLAVIFNYIMAGLDFVAALGFVAVAILAPAFIAKSAAAGGSSPAPPPVFFAVIYGVYAVVALAAGVVSLIAAQLLRKRRRGAFGMGLASGIVSCFSVMWCSFGCVLPLAGGIYTIVILCFERVRVRLQAANDITPPSLNG